MRTHTHLNTRSSTLHLCISPGLHVDDIQGPVERGNSRNSEKIHLNKLPGSENTNHLPSGETHSGSSVAISCSSRRRSKGRCSASCKGRVARRTSSSEGCRLAKCPSILPITFSSSSISPSRELCWVANLEWETHNHNNKVMDVFLIEPTHCFLCSSSHSSRLSIRWCSSFFVTSCGR